MSAATSGWNGGDGLQYGVNVTNFNYAKQLAAVIDVVLNSTTYASRALYNAENFNQTTLQKITKVTRRTQGQWVAGAEPLNSSDESVTILQQANRVMYQMPMVKIFTESFARQYNSAISYKDFQSTDIIDEMIQDLSSAIVSGTGVGNTPNSLDVICDDGTNYSTINGVNRSTYTSLAGTNTNFSAVGSLSKLATMYDTIADTAETETPTVLLVTFNEFSLVESLYSPTVRHEYSNLPVGGRSVTKASAGKGDGMGQGFTALDWRGIPMIRDKAVAAGVGYMLNENYLCWYGDNQIPPELRGFLEKVSLGSAPKEGQSQSMRPSDLHGFFFQKEQAMPTQGSLLGRYWLSGQHVSFQPRRQGRFYGFTGV